MRILLALFSALALVLTSACSGGDDAVGPYDAESAAIGESLAVLGWNIAVTNLRWESDFLLVDVDAAPSDGAEPHAKAEDIRFGLYGALAHPIEATGVGSCARVAGTDVAPLAATTADRLSGTVCLGPIKDQAQVRGVYTYSPRERIPSTAAAYAAAFPVGVLPTNSTDTGLVVKTSSVDAWRADGTQLSETALGDAQAFTGNGYMLLGLEIDGLAAQYRDDSARRGGPLMVVAAPSLPGVGLSQACSVYGSSVLVLPEASLAAVRISASLCTQGEINAALLYATLSVVGTHAGLWRIRD